MTDPDPILTDPDPTPCTPTVDTLYIWQRLTDFLTEMDTGPLVDLVKELRKETARNIEVDTGLTPEKILEREAKPCMSHSPNHDSYCASKGQGCER